MKTFINVCKKITMLITIIATTILLSACIAAAVTGAVVASGASTAYVMGTLRAEINNATPIQLSAATKHAFTKLAINTDEIRVTEVDAVIIGYTANNKKITVKIKRVTAKMTELTIHVGYFGDEALSDLIYNEIIHELKQNRNPVAELVPMATTAVPMMESELESTPAPESTSISVQHTTDPYAPVIEETPPSLEFQSAPVYNAPSLKPEPSPDAVPIPVTRY